MTADVPCAFFEPHTPVLEPAYPGARLPLLDEYDGVCWASGQAESIDNSNRLCGCNLGSPTSTGLTIICPRLLAHVVAEPRARLRFHVAGRTADRLHVMVIEELHYAPERWQQCSYSPETGTLEPDLPQHRQRAQVLAFCRSYLTRFPLTS